MSIIVTTQKELDAAIESGAESIVIDSPPTVQLELRESRHVVEARDWSRVVARESSHVVARDWSAVRAWDYSRVDAARWAVVYRRSMTATVIGGNVI